MSKRSMRGRPPAGGGGGPLMGWSRAQRQALFREMAVGELRRGGMSRGRWQRLVKYSALLDLSAVEAGELIAEAREAVGRARPPAVRLVGADRAGKVAASWPLWVKLAVGGALLGVVDAAVFHWVF